MHNSPLSKDYQIRKYNYCFSCMLLFFFQLLYESLAHTHTHKYIPFERVVSNFPPCFIQIAVTIHFKRPKINITDSTWALVLKMRFVKIDDFYKSHQSQKLYLGQHRLYLRKHVRGHWNDFSIVKARSFCELQESVFLGGGKRKWVTVFWDPGEMTIAGKEELFLC